MAAAKSAEAAQGEAAAASEPLDTVKKGGAAGAAHVDELGDDVGVQSLLGDGLMGAGAELRVGSMVILPAAAAVPTQSGREPPSVQAAVEQVHGDVEVPTSTTSDARVATMLGPQDGSSPAPYQATMLGPQGGSSPATPCQATPLLLHEPSLGLDATGPREGGSSQVFTREASKVVDQTCLAADVYPEERVDVEAPNSRPSPVKQLTDVRSSDGATDVEVGDVVRADEERVDEEIVMEPPPAGTMASSLPPAPSPSVCRFVTPPVVFQRARQPPSQTRSLRWRDLGPSGSFSQRRSRARMHSSRPRLFDEGWLSLTSNLDAARGSQVNLAV